MVVTSADIVRVKHANANERIARLEKAMLHLPQVEPELTHEFADKVYVRTIAMPAGHIVIGHEHKTEHFNIVHRGKCLVNMDGELQQIEGPCMFVSGPGVRKVLWIQEDTLWSTFHVNPDDERDIEKLEARYVVKTQAWLEHHAAVEQLRQEAHKLELLQHP